MSGRPARRQLEVSLEKIKHEMIMGLSSMQRSRLISLCILENAAAASTLKRATSHEAAAHSRAYVSEVGACWSRHVFASYLLMDLGEMTRFSLQCDQ